MEPTQMVTITAKEYDALKARADQLAFLEALGVDNWSGYATLPDREDFDSEEEYNAAVDAAFEGDNW